MKAAGNTITKLALNFSFILHFCVRVAAIVVSEMKERLSPKKAPPSTTATKKGTYPPTLFAKSTARGVRATTVPTDVPIDVEIKHAATKIPGIISSGGSQFMVMATVASIAPILSARLAKAPAKTNIHIIYRILPVPASRENVSIRSCSDR